MMKSEHLKFIYEGDVIMDDALINYFRLHIYHDITNQICMDERVKSARLKFYDVSKNWESKSYELFNILKYRMFTGTE